MIVEGQSKLPKVSSQQQLETPFAKISILNSVESESVFKRNKLMLEHVMLERAISRLNSRKERREAKLLKTKEPPTQEWKIRQLASKDAY
mmetsp:Transcript_327/g.195  ORF Transcript_327/g.195 Transcript_327/m.195 type:complete len:90 (+) Transcript_327:316-585(+)